MLHVRGIPVERHESFFLPSFVGPDFRLVVPDYDDEFLAHGERERKNLRFVDCGVRGFYAVRSCTRLS